MSQEKINLPIDDPYAILGVLSTASEAEIKQAYFNRVRQHSPEKDPQTFKRIRAAYEKLKDPQKRLESDLLRVETWPEPVLKGKRSFPTNVETDDVRLAARAFTKVSKHDFREDYRPVKGKA